MGENTNAQTESIGLKHTYPEQYARFEEEWVKIAQSGLE
jgi:hypothetical protein